ncbi:2-keto-4-pentenoate hydratase [Frankia sp. R43]|uniref:fumarylacetoacetate hydrolase family protein n=1 Tax=Frankia sp. R43 TaxID=269536 RepID=UPI0006CA3B34|nr:fumarylacetoacetate hydrolase family protein [Frankia sp. R43]KPM54049.1 2-keto-4-pentenoate hydratase [Frankia sp. R43]
MRWCRFERGGVPSYGVIVDEQVCPVDGDPFAGHRPSGEPVALAEVRLLAPVLPPTFFAVGLNYASHIEHARERGYALAVMPERPEIGYRANSALIGPGEAIVKPADCTGRFETEGELVAVIGRRVRHCSREQAVDAVFGWTIGNDVSAREWQRSDRTLWRSKNSDTFKPMGPWIETDVDALAATTTVSLDDTEVARFATGDMIFDPYDYIREISRYITLMPGDVLWMGTESVVAMEPGQTVGVTISGIGTLSNPVELEKSSAAAEEK